MARILQFFFFHLARNHLCHYYKDMQRILSTSKDEKLALTMMEPFFDLIRKIGLNKVEDFCGDLKKHSSFENQKNLLKIHFKKEDLFLLLSYLINATEPDKFIPRQLRRVGYHNKNIILTYMAYYYPDIMLYVCHNFNQFEFVHKLHDIDILEYRWEQKIKKIQDIAKQDPTLERLDYDKGLIDASNIKNNQQEHLSVLKTDSKLYLENTKGLVLDDDFFPENKKKDE